MTKLYQQWYNCTNILFPDRYQLHSTLCFSTKHSICMLKFATTHFKKDAIECRYYPDIDDAYQQQFFEMCDAACVKCGQPPRFKCERCFEPYCSSDCQLADFSDHKTRCFITPQLLPICIPTCGYACDGISDQLSRSLHVGSNPNLSGSHRSNLSFCKIHPIDDSTPIGAKRGSADVDKDCSFMPKAQSKNVFSFDPTAALDQISDSDKFPNWCKAFPLPNDFFDAVVQFVEEIVDSKRFIWITQFKFEESLVKLGFEINRSINQSKPCITDSVQPGTLVAASLHNVLYRAKVLSTLPRARKADVRLIDYGNEITVSYNQIFKPIPIMENFNAYAVRVCIANDCGPFELESILTLRVLEDKTDDGGYCKVECKAKNIPLELDVESITKEKSLTVVKSLVDHHNILLRLCNLKDLNMDSVLNEETLKYDFDKVQSCGNFVAARTKCGWKRSCILGYYEEKHIYLVYTIDEGFTCFVSQVKRIPDKFITQFMRVYAISTSSNYHKISDSVLKSENRLSLQLLPTSSENTKTHLSCALYEDTQKIVDVAVVSVFTGRLQELGLKLCYYQIPEGSSVFISHVTTCKQVSIASSITAEYSSIIMSECKKCTPFEVSDPIHEGDVVIVLIPTSACYRATIILSDANTVKVRNVDRGSEHVVKRKYLVKPTEFVKSLPVLCSLVNLMYLESTTITQANNKALAALETCAETMTEFCVTYSVGDKTTADLLFLTKERQSLCKKLLPMLFEPNDTSTDKPPTKYTQPEQPSVSLTPPNEPVTSSAAVTVFSNDAVKYQHYKINDLEIIPLSCGENSSILVLDSSTLTNLQSPYIIAADYNNKESAAKVLRDLSSVHTYCSDPKSPKEGYAPDEMEICLSVYPKDGNWYRAMCSEIHPNDTFEVMFVDYGNCAKVHKKDIMPMTSELLFPISAHMVFVEDITTMKQAIDLQNAMAINSVIIAKVMRSSDNNYTAKVLQIAK